MSKIALIGGSGFIGRNTAALLDSENYIILDLFSPMGTKCKYTYCDITNHSRVRECLEDVDTVLMLAAISNSHENKRDPMTAFNTNIKGLHNVLDACIQTNVKRIIFASSVWMYSLTDDFKVNEDTPLDINKSNHLYITTKAAGEMLIKTYHKQYGLDYTIMRYGIAYGQQSNIETALAAFTNRAINNQTIRINGDGEQFRNFMHVSDHARANLAVLQNENTINQTINFDGPSQVTLNNIIDFLRERHPDLHVEYVDPINGDYRGREVSTLKAQTLTDWQPRVRFADGIKEYYERLLSGK